MSMSLLGMTGKGMNAISKLHSVLWDISQAPYGARVADRHLGGDNTIRMKAASKFEHVQI